MAVNNQNKKKMITISPKKFGYSFKNTTASSGLSQQRRYLLGNKVYVSPSINLVLSWLRIWVKLFKSNLFLQQLSHFNVCARGHNWLLECMFNKQHCKTFFYYYYVYLVKIMCLGKKESLIYSIFNHLLFLYHLMYALIIIYIQI